MINRFGGAAALFSLKCFAAAMLALFVAFSIGLERPYWAFLTTFIVAQPLAGAVLSKALFRILGTLIGATATVLMVPPLVNAPELLSIALAGWVALCVFVSLLDRTPRAYMFVLSGYTCCLIAFPSVGIPGQIFTVASLRVQEILIGILCGSLVHGLVFPGSVANLLLTRVEAILRDAERWSRDAIAIEPVPALDAERRRLARDVAELHQLSGHLPFETARLSPRVRTVRALQDQLSLLMPLGAAVEDRVALLQQSESLSPALAALLDDSRAWLAAPGSDRAARHEAAEALRARCAALEPAAGRDLDWAGMLALNLLARLSELIAAHRDCRDLDDQLRTHGRGPVSARVAALLDGRRARELHRDVGGAARGASSAFLTILIGCCLWIGSGWHDGGTAVMMAGVFLALFSASDDPVAPLRAFMVGTVLATIIGAIYGFAILPRVDGFPLLVAVLAPTLLAGGAMLASPRYGIVALSMLLGLGSPVLLGERYVSNFPEFANGALAQFTGIWFAIVMARLLQSAGAEAAVRRTIRAGWTDLANRCLATTPPDTRAWINRMLDRMGLLAPRLAARGEACGALLYGALRDLRTGVAVGELRQLRFDRPRAAADPLTPVLQDVSAYYRTLDPDAPRPAPTRLLAGIDAAIATLAGDADATIRRRATLGLVSLRRALFPDVSAYSKGIAA